MEGVGDALFGLTGSATASYGTEYSRYAILLSLDCLRFVNVGLLSEHVSCPKAARRPNLPDASTLSMAQSSSSGSSSLNTPSSRRRAGLHRERYGSATADLEDSLDNAQQAVPQLTDLIRNVVGAIDHGARLKKHHFEKHRQTKEQSNSRPLVRTKSARSGQSAKKRVLVRHVSEELVDKTNVASSSHEQSVMADMSWSSRFADTKVVISTQPQGTHTGPLAAEAQRMTVGADDQSLRNYTSYLKEDDSTARVRSTMRIQNRTDPRADVVAMPPPPTLQHQQRLPKNISDSHNVSHCASAAYADSTRAENQARFSCLTSSQPSFRPPPALGMRRTSTYNGTSTAAVSQSSQNLPTKQRSFKVPFNRHTDTGSQVPAASPASASRPIARMKVQAKTASATDSPDSTPSPSCKARFRPPVREEPPSRSPSPELEADSSYGDISFDMDAVEETMRQFDEV